MIDPLAGPWTISRDRRDSERGIDLGEAFRRVRSRSRRLLEFLRPARSRSAHRALRPARREVSTPRAVLLLTVITLAGLVLAWTTVSMVTHGLVARNASAKAIAGPLVYPAPKQAGSLPRRYGAVSDPAAGRVIAEFIQRFEAAGHGLVPGPGASGVAVIRPAALYGEPGHIDPATGRPAWIMYLGFDASRQLGAPAATLSRLMSSLLGPSSMIGPWRVPPGSRGGSANCTVAVLGQTQVSVCAWATERTLGAVVSPVRATDVRELAALLIKIRFDLQTR